MTPDTPTPDRDARTPTAPEPTGDAHPDRGHAGDPGPSPDAVLSHDGGRHTVRFERRLAHPVAVVWSALTEERHLAHWFPTTIRGDLEAGAPLRFEFRDEGDGAWDFDGSVVEIDPPHLLVIRWGPDELRAELTPTEDGCLLVFTDTVAELGTVARDTAGWHVCLDHLVARLAGDASDAPTSEKTDAWQAHFDRYRARFGAASATVTAGPDA